MSGIHTDRNEYALSSWIGEFSDLREILKCTKENGFDYVELWGDSVHFDPRAEINRNEIKSWLKEYSLSVHSVHAPFRRFKPVFRDAREFLSYRMNLWHRTIEDCSEFEVPIMVMHGLDRGEYNYKNSEISIVKDVFADLCDYGSKFGVTIALENIPPSGAEDEIICTLQNQKKLYGDIPGLKYCLDIGHVVLSGVEMHDEIDAAMPDIVTMHIHNNDGRNDLHNLPDDGVIDWPEVHDYMRKKGYTAQFVLEVFGGENPFEKIRELSSLFD